MDKCETCKHFKMDPAVAKRPTESDLGDFRYGTCLIKLGDSVEIEIEVAPYGGGATIGDITVDAVFGCMAHEAK